MMVMVAAERSQIQFGLTTIPFLTRRSARRTTVALTVEPPGKLVVTAPPAATVDDLNRLVHRKGSWVVERIKRSSDLPPPPSDREYVTGETFLCRGRQLRLRLIPGSTEFPEAALHGGWLDIPVDQRLSGKEKAMAVRRVLVAWLKEHADAVLPYRLGELCRQHHLEKPSIVIREQRKRWGSCDARGVLRINWRIIQASTSLIDYVLAHELVHLRHPNHTTEFWATLGRMMPDYEQRKRRLRELGPSLEW